MAVLVNTHVILIYSYTSNRFQIPDFIQPYEIARQTSQETGTDIQTNAMGQARWMAANQVRPSITSVITNSIPSAAAVSPVPTAAVYHISAEMAINMARATTRRLASLCSSNSAAGQKAATSHCGANKGFHRKRRFISTIAECVVNKAYFAGLDLE